MKQQTVFTTQNITIKNPSKKSPQREVKIPPYIATQSSSEEVRKTLQKETGITNEKFENLVKKSQNPLFVLSSVFPFDLFPDTISIEPNQVNVVKKSFFATSHIQSIPIKNIADTFLETTPFFSSLRIIDSSYIENSIQVNFLWRWEAKKARRIIQGLVVACKEGIDLTKLDNKQLAKKAEEIGAIHDHDVFEKSRS